MAVDSGFQTGNISPTPIDGLLFTREEEDQITRYKGSLEESLRAESLTEEFIASERDVGDLADKVDSIFTHHTKMETQLALVDAPMKSRANQENSLLGILALDHPQSRAQSKLKAKVFLHKETAKDAQQAMNAGYEIIRPMYDRIVTPCLHFEVAKEIREGRVPALKKVRVLGQGAYGRVNQSEYVGRTFAHKESLKAHFGQTLTKELSTMQQFDHPNVMSAKYLCGDGSILMDFCEGGSLESLDKDTLDHDRFVSIIRTAASGINHIHSRGYVHRDIKPGNILVHENAAMIADLDMAVTFRDFETCSFAGTATYTPKEYVRGNATNPMAIDTFAYGMVLFNFLKREEIYSPYVMTQQELDVEIGNKVERIRKDHLENVAKVKAKNRKKLSKVKNKQSPRAKKIRKAKKRALKSLHKTFQEDALRGAQETREHYANQLNGKYDETNIYIYKIGMYQRELDEAHLAPLLDDATCQRLDPTGQIRQVMVDCLKENPDQRPSMQEVEDRLAAIA